MYENCHLSGLLEDLPNGFSYGESSTKSGNYMGMFKGNQYLTQIEVGSVSESQALTLRKMFVAMSNDLRVIVIKLADRLHNMRTLYALNEDRQIFKANETLEIFAPIAHRLGIDSIK